MENRTRNNLEPSSETDPVSALLADTDIDPSAMRMCVMLVLTDLFAADPESRTRFTETLKLAREKALNEKTDAKILTIDLALSLIQTIPSAAK